ncbi:hypothetical protein BACCIP111895_03113 [Neobacillus rhizosphaerae]|uniref:Uncharacterized protein n=1 Tax=Neobacillus rhizosphaerae TaxID=2880965 RepID=A0ABN8KQG0_9BACI|nr:hypothetical protein BACCIP111895_03113 [Neobacillus rhizosphaerae]
MYQYEKHRPAIVGVLFTAPRGIEPLTSSLLAICSPAFGEFHCPEPSARVSTSFADGSFFSKKVK